ncbi:MAG: bifunctional adenosylcobinamide kinase/adenosylcobinamide-phosphate guanylyltransferase [Anaerolineales bacterium]|nr:bifunctional adenosylcobinamide kinase/adenosylcobinamide-phosphate guanylyltransferase [Anaerolineales bacterium]
MGRLIFILGGARSGKSTYAQRLAERSGKSVTYIATAQAGDDEMSARIIKHRADRPAEWTTLESQQNIAAYLKAHPTQAELYLLDCMTLLVANIIFQFTEGEVTDEQKAADAIKAEMDELLAYIRTQKADWIIVSNEVGLGLVPPYPLGRIYRDLLGMANQRIAANADEVYMLMAGIPVPIHGYRE